MFLQARVLLKDLRANKTLKVIKFYNAYCLGLEDLYGGTRLGHRSPSYRTCLLISPQAVAVNGHFHDWPGANLLVIRVALDLAQACNLKCKKPDQQPSA